jgi:hypothetical protein
VNRVDRFVIESRRRKEGPELAFLETLPDALGTLWHFDSRGKSPALKLLRRAMIEMRT